MSILHKYDKNPFSFRYKELILFAFYSFRQIPLLDFIALVAAITIASSIKKAIIDPVATVAMVVSYHDAVQDEQPAVNMKETLANVSNGFKKLLAKENEPLPQSSSEAKGGVSLKG